MSYDQSLPKTGLELANTHEKHLLIKEKEKINVCSLLKGKEILFKDKQH